MHPSSPTGRPDSREGYAAVRDGKLFYREIGQGLPTIVLHGGPDFDHRYLLPELDRLSDWLRLIYYDQRGRGWSAPGVAPEAVTIESEIEDLDGLRESISTSRPLQCWVTRGAGC
jgi:proline iminopeptidase